MMTKKISQENKIELDNIDHKDCNVCDTEILSGERFSVEENQEIISVMNNNDETIKIMKRITCV